MGPRLYTGIGRQGRRGCLEPQRIVNHTMPFNVIDLNGAWADQNGVRPHIHVYNQPGAAAGYTIAVDRVEQAVS